MRCPTAMIPSRTGSHRTALLICAITGWGWPLWNLQYTKDFSCTLHQPSLFSFQKQRNIFQKCEIKKTIEWSPLKHWTMISESISEKTIELMCWIYKIFNKFLYNFRFIFGMVKDLGIVWLLKGNSNTGSGCGRSPPVHTHKRTIERREINWEKICKKSLFFLFFCSQPLVLPVDHSQKL